MPKPIRQRSSLGRNLLLTALVLLPAWVVGSLASRGERKSEGQAALAPRELPGSAANSVATPPAALAQPLADPLAAAQPNTELGGSRERSSGALSHLTHPANARISALLQSQDPRERFEGLRQLANVDPGRAATEILEYIEDTRDVERALLQRLSAVQLLGELEGVSLWHELTELYDGEEPGVRRAAALALAKHGDDSLIERELAALEPDLAAADGGLRARAAESVANLGNPRTLPVLLALLDDPNSDVRAHAVDGLWRAGDVLALPDAQRLLSDPVPRVRERARRAVDALRALQSGGSEPLGR